MRRGFFALIICCVLSFRVRFYFYEEQKRPSGRITHTESGWKTGKFDGCGYASNHVDLIHKKTKIRYIIQRTDCEWITTRFLKKRRLKCSMAPWKYIIFSKRSSTHLDKAMFPACNVMHGNFQRVVEESYRDAGFVRNSQGGWELPPAADLGDDDDAGSGDDAEDDETTEERYPGFDWDSAPFDKDSPEIIPPPVGLSKHTVIDNVALHVPESPQVMSQSSSFGRFGGDGKERPHTELRVGSSQSQDFLIWFGIFFLTACIFFGLGMRFATNRKSSLKHQFLLAEET